MKTYDFHGMPVTFQSDPWAAYRALPGFNAQEPPMEETKLKDGDRVTHFVHGAGTVQTRGTLCPTDAVQVRMDNGAICWARPNDLTKHAAAPPAREEAGDSATLRALRAEGYRVICDAYVEGKSTADEVIAALDAEREHRAKYGLPNALERVEERRGEGSEDQSLRRRLAEAQSAIHNHTDFCEQCDKALPSRAHWPTVLSALCDAGRDLALAVWCLELCLCPTADRSAYNEAVVLYGQRVPPAQPAPEAKDGAERRRALVGVALGTRTYSVHLGEDGKARIDVGPEAKVPMLLERHFSGPGPIARTIDRLMAEEREISAATERLAAGYAFGADIAQGQGESFTPAPADIHARCASLDHIHEKRVSVEEARAQWEKKPAPLSDPRWDLDDGDRP